MRFLDVESLETKVACMRARAKNGFIHWSVQFQNKLARLSEFYASYAGKKNPFQKALDKWEKLAEGDIIIKPKYEKD